MDAEQLGKLMQRYAESQGFQLNPDKKIVDLVLQGLLRNEKKFGYRYCPCRAIVGDKKEDAPKICPCKWHKDEIRQMGHCLCGLFVAKA